MASTWSFRVRSGRRLRWSRREQPNHAPQGIRGGRQRSVTESHSLRQIVVPIHDAFEAMARCLEALEAHTASGTTLLLIDDAGRDPRVIGILDRIANGGSGLAARLLGNESRRDYTATINCGCREASGDEVVLLNSDTEVTPGWLKKLVDVASNRPSVATVTAVSNSAGAFSVSLRGRRNPLPPELGMLGMARLVEEVSPRLHPSVPTGNGFCMLVRREALERANRLYDLLPRPLRHLRCRELRRPTVSLATRAPSARYCCTLRPLLTSGWGAGVGRLPPGDRRRRPAGSRHRLRRHRSRSTRALT